MFRVIYVSSKRAKEREILKASPLVDFREVKLHLRSSIRGYLSSLFALPTLLIGYEPHIVLFEAAGGVSALPALLLCRLLGLPYLVRLKGDLWRAYTEIELSMPVAEKLVRHLNFQVTAFALSGASGVLPIASQIERVFRLHTSGKKPSHVVPIPFDEAMLRTSSDCSPDRKDVAPPLILTVTNFNFWNKVEPLVEAIPAIYPITRVLGASWIIVGGGLFLEECRRLLPEYAEILAGHVDGKELAQLYKEASLLLYISGADGLPNVLLEASLFRLPILINQDCPAVEFVKDGETGIVVDIHNSDSCRRELEQLLTNSGLGKQLGQNAHDYVISNFSADAVSKALEKGLYAVLQQLP